MGALKQRGRIYRNKPPNPLPGGLDADPLKPPLYLNKNQTRHKEAHQEPRGTRRRHVTNLYSRRPNDLLSCGAYANPAVLEQPQNKNVTGHHQKDIGDNQPFHQTSCNLAYGAQVRGVPRKNEKDRQMKTKYRGAKGAMGHRVSDDHTDNCNALSYVDPADAVASFCRHNAFRRSHTCPNPESQKLFSYFLPPNLAARNEPPFLTQFTGSVFLSGTSTYGTRFLTIHVSSRYSLMRPGTRASKELRPE